MTNSEKLKTTYPELEGESSIFEKFIVWLYRNKKDFAIATGIVYGHQMLKKGNYTFTEISPNEVIIDSDDFYLKVTSVVELIKIYSAIR